MNIVLALRNRRAFIDGKTYRTIRQIHALGRAGLKPALDYLGIKTYVKHYRESGSRSRSDGLNATAMVYPAASVLCGRLNTLLQAESAPDCSRFTYAIYSDHEKPTYSNVALAENLSDRIELIASEPHMYFHDIEHALSAYCLAEILPPIFQEDANNALASRDEVALQALNFSHEASASAPAILGNLHPGSDDWADTVYPRLLEGRESPTPAEVAANIQYRIASTGQRIASLGLVA